MDNGRFGRLFDRFVQLYIAGATSYGVYLETQAGSSTKPAPSHSASLGFIKGGILDFVPHWINAPLVLIVTGVLLTIINYVLRRNNARVALTASLNFRSSDIAPYVSGIGYPRKLNVYLSNDGDDIHLGIAKWTNDRVGLQAGMPPRIVYLLKDHPVGQFHSESLDKFVPSGMWVKIWVGLNSDSTVPESDLIQWCKDRRLGIVEIPATISGAAFKIRIPV
jgi:hypothetical protein